MVNSEVLDCVFDTDNLYSGSLRLLTTCLNYSDYLTDTLEYNTHIFDKIDVVTSTSDKDTIKLCEKYRNVNCILTNAFHKNRAVFNKGAAIDYRLQQLPKLGWLLIGDADCIFPKTIRQDINNLDKNKLYSYRRHLVENKQHLSDIMSGKKEPIFLPNRNAWRALGYCQLFSLESTKKINYPTHIGNASRSDTIFSSSWERDEKMLLTNGYVLHLDQTNANWRGRRTDKWK